MVSTGTQGLPEDDWGPERRAGRRDRFQDDLVGLDPDDPDALAFAEHLDRMERVRNGYTVEGYLGGVQDFAESANRLGGHRRLTAGILAALILLGVVVAAWDSVLFILGVLFG
ncbi:hypothetical protein [Actinokineospora pegani]|uniref:hypothetical protein n=1 Tax=Actinokineospora pegani TaxID=2654637 RepID=UPI0018D399F6|nr:hypothetical protein [Actinokineospora pegani]